MTRPEDALPIPAFDASRLGRRSERSVGVVRILRDASLALGPHRRLLVPISILAMVVGLVETVVLFLIARLASVLSSTDRMLDLSVGPFAGTEISIGTAVLICLALLVLLLALAIPMASLTATLGTRALVRERTRLVEAYLLAEWSYRSDAAEGHLQDLLGEYCQRTERVVQQVSTIVVAGCGTIAMCIGAFVLAPIAALVAVVGLGVIGIAVRPLTKRLKFGSTRFAKINRAFAANVAQTARVSEEIASFDVSDNVAAMLGEDIERSGAALKTFRLVSRLTPVLFQYGTLIIVVGLIGVLSMLSPEGLTALGAIVLLLVRVLVYLKQLQTASQTGLEMAPYVDALEGEIAMLARHEASRSGVDLERLDPVRFESVSFNYQPGKPALDHVSFTIMPGEAVGVVGPSGGGKSTTTHLLLRLRKPTAGRIMVGDLDLMEISPASWARLTARVPQDNKLISGTVSDNIRFFRSGYDDDDVVGAARAAHLHDEIVALPDGYQTLLGPAGRDLSGGQRQRIGIARALLGRPQLLILDEPTSALDGRSENLIQETLHELRGTTTLVIVAHRPATLEICDRILRVEDGRFVPASPV